MAENANQFAELETKLAEREQEIAALRQASEAQAAANKLLGEQVQRMAAEQQTQRFTALIKNDGARWFGEDAQHLSILGTLAQTFGEQSEQFAAYVAQQKGVAAALRTSSAFQEQGADGGGRTEDASAKLDRLASERAAERSISYSEALAMIASENPTLYAQHSSAAYVRTKGAE
jgi:hypothetical protein